MKNKAIIFLILTISVFTLITLSGDVQANDPPGFDNKRVENVDRNSGDLHSDVFDNDGDDLEWVAFQKEDGTLLDNQIGPFTEPYNATYSWTGLNDDTLYGYEIVAKDNYGNVSTSLTQYFGTDADDPPTASFTHDGPVYTDELVNFDASGSSDDYAIENYQWDWTDDSSTDYITPDSSASHSYPDDGEYTVWLLVTDDNDQFDTTEENVTVMNRNPTADFTYSVSGLSVSFDGGNSSDSDGSISSYEWDPDGDGIFENTGQTTTFTYDSMGSYDVMLRVTDDDLGEDNITKTVSLNTSPVVENLSPSTRQTSNDVTIGADGYDSDGDDLNFMFYDNSNGNLIDNVWSNSGTNATVIWDNLNDGENYSFYAIVSDSYDNSGKSPVVGFRVNEEPEAEPEISPLSPLSDNDLVVSPNVSDYDGDTVTAHYQWYEDNGTGYSQMDGETDNTLSSVNIVSGNSYYCTVKPDDSYENGTKKETTKVLVEASANLLIESYDLYGYRDNATLEIEVKYSDGVSLDNVSSIANIGGIVLSRVENNTENKLQWTGIEIPADTENIEIYPDNLSNDRTGVNLAHVEDNVIINENTKTKITIDDTSLITDVGEPVTFTGTVKSGTDWVSMDILGELVDSESTKRDNTKENVEIGGLENWSLTVTPSEVGTQNYTIKIYQNPLVYEKSVTVDAVEGTGSASVTIGTGEEYIYVQVQDSERKYGIQGAEAEVGGEGLYATTNESGIAKIEGLDAEEYQIKITKDGYKEKTINVNPSEKDSITVNLQRTSGGLSKVKILAFGAVTAVVLVVVFMLLVYKQKKEL